MRPAPYCRRLRGRERRDRWRNSSTTTSAAWLDRWIERHRLGHVPRRPSWTCQFCGRQWPCPPAKAKLTREYEGAGTQLLIYLGGHLAGALVEIDDAPAAVYQRIVGWAR